MKFIGAPDAHRLQGMLYSSVKCTGAPDDQCLQGTSYSLVKFTGAPDAQCLQGMPYSLVTLAMPLRNSTTFRDVPPRIEGVYSGQRKCVLHYIVR